jgi:dolichol-phosphate mannosyltransferase
MAGFAHARGDAVIYMDTDLQDPPELIPAMLEKWQQGADVVHTTRSRRHGENPLKMWITKKAYQVIRSISEYPLIENAGDFKLISRKVLDLVLAMKENDPYLRGLVGWIGFRQEQVFYEREARFAGQTKFPLLRSMNPYREFFRGVTGFSDIPLYFGFFCAAVFGFGSALLILILLGRMGCGLGFSPWLAFSTLLCISMALLFAFLSLIGVYLGAVLRQVRHRPHCLARELIGFDTNNPTRVERSNL